MNNGLVVILFIILALLGAYSIYQPFLLAISVAILLTMATYNMTEKLNIYFKSRRLVALLITALMTLLIFAPLAYIATVGVSFASTIDANTISNIIASIEIQVKKFPQAHNWFIQNISNEKIASFVQSYSSYLASLGKVGLAFLTNFFFVLIFYYFLNYYGDRVFAILSSLVPLSKVKSAKIVHEISSTMEIVFYSTIVTAIFEGFLFGVFVSFFGFDGLLFGIIYGLASLIPVVGGVIVWAPISLYLWSNGDTHGAIVVAIYSIVAIAIIADTFIKPYIIKIIKRDFLHSTVEINELVIFFAIFAGMSSYGFWGIIIGPAITALFIGVAKVYLDYNCEHKASCP
jgi:predicted PurR-regulated permease PerM